MNVKDIHKTLTEYINLINTSEIFLETSNILIATAKVISNTALSRAYDDYVDSMNTSKATTIIEYKNIQNKIMNRALEQFDNIKQIGPKEYYKIARDQLCKQINNHSELQIKTIKILLEWKTPTIIGLTCFCTEKVWMSICSRIFFNGICTPPSVLFEAIYTFSLIILSMRYYVYWSSF